ncbi:MAG TPA: hypothetical protein DIT25_03730 [Candidatus Moranbacteria bacterium]|nr:hypothetical protein [Candidatus Moranbacteria bacterium]
MGKIMRIDGDKVREELKLAESSLVYWTNLMEKHPAGNTHFDSEIARASGKADALKFALSHCSR